ncbi:MAG: universal stress protein [Rickettsiales bacterium]|nr:universal stress protein [Rickettsiales bacterium]
MDIARPFANPVTKPPRYMVCVDHREESRTALRLACMKALARSGSVVIVHVIPPADFQTLGAIADRMREERKKEGEELLQTLINEAAAHYGVTPAPVLREGAAGDEIVANALEDHDVIMLVIGVASHNNGRGKLSAWLASQLGNKLLVPLLMVPGNLTDEQLQSLV